MIREDDKKGQRRTNGGSYQDENGSGYDPRHPTPAADPAYQLGP